MLQFLVLVLLVFLLGFLGLLSLLLLFGVRGRLDDLYDILFAATHVARFVRVIAVVLGLQPVLDLHAWSERKSQTGIGFELIELDEILVIELRPDSRRYRAGTICPAGTVSPGGPVRLLCAAQVHFGDAKVVFRPAFEDRVPFAGSSTSLPGLVSDLPAAPIGENFDSIGRAIGVGLAVRPP